MPLSLRTSIFGQFRVDAHGQNTTPQHRTLLDDSVTGGIDKGGESIHLPFRPRGEQGRSRLVSVLLGTLSGIYFRWAVLEAPGRNATPRTTKFDFDEQITGDIDTGGGTNLSLRPGWTQGRGLYIPVLIGKASRI